jgi:hypothetical protein
MKRAQARIILAGLFKKNTCGYNVYYICGVSDFGKFFIWYIQRQAMLPPKQAVCQRPYGQDGQTPEFE